MDTYIHLQLDVYKHIQTNMYRHTHAYTYERGGGGGKGGGRRGGGGRKERKGEKSKKGKVFFFPFLLSPDIAPTLLEKEEAAKCIPESQQKSKMRHCECQPSFLTWIHFNTSFHCYWVWVAANGRP